MFCVFSIPVRDNPREIRQNSVNPSPHNILAISSIFRNMQHKKSFSSAQLTHDDTTHDLPPPRRGPNHSHEVHDRVRFHQERVCDLNNGHSSTSRVPFRMHSMEQRVTSYWRRHNTRANAHTRSRPAPHVAQSDGGPQESSPPTSALLPPAPVVGFRCDTHG